MDDADRKEAVAAGTVAIAGIMALCTELATSRVLERGQVKAIGDFMLDAVARSEASPPLQADLQEALSAHFVPLLDALAERDRSGSAPGS